MRVHRRIDTPWWKALGLAAACLTVALASGAGSVAAAAPASGNPAPCLPPASPPRPPTPTTLSTIEQAYHCVFDHYFGGSTLDDRVVLAGAFAGLAQELNRRGIDQAGVALPPMSGNRDGDWDAFSTVYQKVVDDLVGDPAQRQAVAAATMSGLVGSLNDNHAFWSRPQRPPGSSPNQTYGLGITTSPAHGLAVAAPQEALPPLYVASVAPGSPAAENGLRPGDVITAVDGSAVFVAGVLSGGAMNLLNQQYPQDQAVRLSLWRPATGRNWTATMKPTVYTAPGSGPSATLLRGDIAYVTLPGFSPGAADAVLRAISILAGQARLRGAVLDLRGNGGGSVAEVSRLLGAFTHDAIWGYDCDVNARCTADRVDSSVPLLNLRLAVLTDRNCASACDAFSAAVRDLRLGPLIGVRSAGVVSGRAASYLLNDNSVLALPSTHFLGARKEIIDGIGVPVDYVLPTSARDLSTGQNPGLVKALTLLD